MMTYREQKLLAVAEAYSSQTGKALSAVSRQFLNDSKTLSSIAADGTISVARYEAALKGMAEKFPDPEKWPVDVDWPADIPRPSVAA